MQSKDSCSVALVRLHTSVYSQCYSPCCKYLALATNYGHIAIVSLNGVLGPDATTESWRPFFTFKGQEHGIFHLLSTETLLISGGLDGITAWNWKDILSKNPVAVWSMSVPAGKQHLDSPEVNKIAIDSQDDTSKLYAGCGDNLVHVWDIETGQKITSLEGHEDYIHDIALRQTSHDCVSASEDGTVKFWDLRSPKAATATLAPYKNDECARPHLGKYQACLALDAADDWLVCGGGPHLSLWNLRRLSDMTAVFTQSAEEVQHQHVMFHDDAVISGGSTDRVMHWSVNGDLRAQVPCSATSVFNVAINNRDGGAGDAAQHKVLSVVGQGNLVDICTNFGYKALSINVY